MNSASKQRSILHVLWVLLVLASGVITIEVRANGRDSVVTVVVEPGVTHMSIVKDGPYTLNVLVVDLTARNLRIESFRPIGLVPTSQQAARNNRQGHEVIAAINADFFSFTTGWPVNNQVENGEFVFGSPSQRSHLVIDDNGKAYIERVSFEGWVKSKAGRTYAIAGVNDVHRNNAIVLHTSFSDTATRFPGPGVAFLLRLLNSTWSLGDTLRTVVQNNGDIDLSHIPSGEAALWVGGGSSVWGAREDVNVGDTVLVYLGTKPALRNVRTIVGGVGMIVSDGKPVSDSINVGERTSTTFLRARHPRTFVGFDRDTTKLFLCTVDGRQQKSIGMNFHEMADFLLSIGVWNAINLDGGGSTTMVIRGKIVNSPSDAKGERPVANSLQVISLGPPDTGR